MDSQREPVFVFKYGRHEHRNNVQLGRFSRNRSNVCHYPGATRLLATVPRSGSESSLGSVAS